MKKIVSSILLMFVLILTPVCIQLFKANASQPQQGNDSITDTTVQKIFNYDAGQTYTGYISCNVEGATYSTSDASGLLSIDNVTGKFSFKNDDVNGGTVVLPYTIKAAGYADTEGTLTFNRRNAENSTLLTKHEASPVYQVPIRNFSKDVMPITGWVAPRANIGCSTQKIYDELYESGVNIPIANKDFANTQDAVDAATFAENSGVSYMGDCDTGATVEERIEYLTQLTKDKLPILMQRKSFVGMLTKDEPSIPEFENQNKYRKVLEDAGYGELLNYCNLLPVWAPVYALRGEKPWSSMMALSGKQASADDVSCTNAEYQEYVNKFVDIVKPSFLSFDNYCVIGEFPGTGNRYFENMRIIADKAQEVHIPFWAFNLTTGHGSYRIPTEADIQWQVNCALAYGAKGIQYFCYQMPWETKPDPGWQYLGGSYIDINGQKTQQYEYGKRMNKQISEMDKVLMNSTRVELNYLNGGICDFDNSGAVQKDNFRELSKVSSDGNLLMGCFDHQGKTAIYFVNNNLENPLSANAQFSNYVEANMYTNNGVSKMNGQALTFNLEPGRAMLLELTNYEGDFDVIDASSANVSVPGAEYSFTGTEVTPQPIVEFAGATLTAGVDYTVSYANNINPGEATLTVNFINRYCGQKSITFKINGKNESMTSPQTGYF